MIYGETKIYHDGSHYVGIPYKPRPVSRKRPKIDEKIVVKHKSGAEKGKAPTEEVSESERYEFEELEDFGVFGDDEPLSEEPQVTENIPRERTMTRKELFENLYKQHIDKPRRERMRIVYKEMRPFFDSDEKAKKYVSESFERKARNLMMWRIRMTRKANLQDFNYFCTFTYSSKLHTEESFKKKLKIAFRNFCFRRGWKYMGVWERSPEKNRLHFHGIFYIPGGDVPEGFEKLRDYSFKEHDRKVTNQSIYFRKRFGRNDFEPIEDNRRMGEALAYLMKYIEKTEEKIVYSKGLPQFFISDILEDDIITYMGDEFGKFVLFDDFSCWDEGVYVGQASPETIEKLRKMT